MDLQGKTSNTWRHGANASKPLKWHGKERRGGVPREVVQELAPTCFIMAGVARSFRVGTVAHGRQLFHRHVAAQDGPFVILVQNAHADEPDDGRAVVEDPGLWPK